MISHNILKKKDISDLSEAYIDSSKKMLCCSAVVLEEDKEDCYETYCIIENMDRKIPVEEVQALLADVFTGFENCKDVKEVSISSMQWVCNKRDLEKLMEACNVPIFVCVNIPPNEKPKEEENKEEE